MDIEILRSAYKRQIGKVNMFLHTWLGINSYTRPFLENYKAILYSNLFDELIKLHKNEKYANYALDKLISKKAKKVYIDLIRSLKRDSILKKTIATDRPPEDYATGSFLNEMEAKDTVDLIRKFLISEDYNLLYYHGAEGYTFHQILQIANYSSADAARTRYYRLKKLVNKHFGIQVFKNCIINVENKSKQLKKLFILMIQFFEKNAGIRENILRSSNRFLFHNRSSSELHKYAQLYNTLLYLKDIMKRSYLKDIDSLIKYFEQKQRGIEDMFDSYVQAEAEEQLATTFRSSFETFLKINEMENHKKSEYLYYPISETHYLVGYENISYKNSIEEEILYLAKIKGNQLASQKNVSRISLEKNNRLIAN